MSTIALNKNAYEGERKERVSLKERMRKYFAENAATIAAGLLLLNGSTSAYDVYRLLGR